MIPSPGSQALLRAARVFESMTDEEVDAFTVFVTERRLIEGQALFREGDPAASLFVLLQGEVSVSLRGPRGEALTVARLGAGNLLSEHCCLEPGFRSATVAATSRVLCLELTHDALERMLYARPRVASQLLGAILEDLSERVREVELRIATMVDGEAEAPPPPRPSPIPPRLSQPPSVQPLSFVTPPPSAWERLRSRFGVTS